MKPLVVYYSLEGNTRCIAEAIAAEVAADVLELTPVKAPNPTGFMRFFWGGKQVMMGEQPELTGYDLNPADYGPVFVGTPVWAGSFAPALKTFFAGAPLQGQVVGLFCCYMGSPGRTFPRMRAALEGNTVTGEISFKDPLKHKTEDAKRRAAEWARGILDRG